MHGDALVDIILASYIGEAVNIKYGNFVYMLSESSKTIAVPT